MSITAEWENFLVSLLKVTSWTTIIQKMILCSTHKHVGEVHTLRHLKARRKDRNGESQTQSCTGLSPNWHGSTEGWVEALMQQPREWHRQRSSLSTHCNWAQWQRRRWSTKVWQPQSERKNKDDDMQIYLTTLADMVALEVLGCSPQLAVQRGMTQASFWPE